MNLTDYVRLLARRGWIVLLLAVIAGGSAFFLSRQQTPVYRSTQLVLIQPSRTDFGLTEASRQLLDPLVVYLDSQLRAAEIIEDLRLDMTPQQLDGATTIASNQLRMVIQIDVDNTDGDLANNIALAWGQKLVDYRNELNQLARREDRVNALLPDLPRYVQHAPRPFISGAAGAILGVLLGGVIVFVLEYLESNTIRRSDDLERVMDSPVLASIPNFES